MQNKPILQIQDVSFIPNYSEKAILKEINYEIHPFDFVILLGSNGSGKSTLMKLIEQKNIPTKGAIVFDGNPLKNYSKKKLSHEIKTLTQNCDESLFTSLTLWENYLLMKGKLSHGNERLFLKHYLSEFNANLSMKLDEKVSCFSGGEKQTLALAFLFLNPPRLLLLDEHTSALDPKTAQLNMELTFNMITKYNITCLLTTHNLEIAMKYGNKILVIRDGKIAHKIEKEEKRILTPDQMLEKFYAGV
jgi:putative ABC transport system ATP-binding protein